MSRATVVTQQCGVWHIKHMPGMCIYMHVLDTGLPAVLLQHNAWCTKPYLPNNQPGAVRFRSLPAASTWLMVVLEPGPPMRLAQGRGVGREQSGPRHAVQQPAVKQSQ